MPRREKRQALTPNLPSPVSIRDSSLRSFVVFGLLRCLALVKGVSHVCVGCRFISGAEKSRGARACGCCRAIRRPRRLCLVSKYGSVRSSECARCAGCDGRRRRRAASADAAAAAHPPVARQSCGTFQPQLRRQQSVSVSSARTGRARAQSLARAENSNRLTASVPPETGRGNDR